MRDDLCIACARPIRWHYNERHRFVSCADIAKGMASAKPAPTERPTHSARFPSSTHDARTKGHLRADERRSS